MTDPEPEPAADGDATGGGSTAVVLIAHGSRNPRTAEAHAELCRRVGDAAGGAVHPAYLELSEPSIPDAVDAAVAAGATTVRLVPYFLHVGNHVLSDLPGLADEAAARNPSARVVLEEHVGADPRLIDLLADRVTTPHPPSCDERGRCPWRDGVG